MNKLDRIAIDPNIYLGQPAIRGTRITVSVVLKMLGNGHTIAKVLEAYPELEYEDVYQAMRYAAWVVSDGDANPKTVLSRLLIILPKMESDLLMGCAVTVMDWGYRKRPLPI